MAIKILSIEDSAVLSGQYCFIQRVADGFVMENSNASGNTPGTLITQWIMETIDANPHCAEGDNEQVWLAGEDDGASLTKDNDGIHYLVSAGMIKKAAQLSAKVLTGL